MPENLAWGVGWVGVCSNFGCSDSFYNFMFYKSCLFFTEFVHVEWTDGNEQKRQTFLLDNGRLKLDIVQKTFGATLVEICKGERLSM